MPDTDLGTWNIMTLEELNKIVDEIVTHHTEYKTTPRELLEAFNAYRRTSGNVRYVDNYLKSHNIMTRPNYNSVWLDENIILQQILLESSTETKRTKQSTPHDRVKRIINRSAAFRTRIEKISNLNADLSIFERIPIVVGELPTLLINDELTDKIKEVLSNRISEIETNLNKIDTYSQKGRINRTRLRITINDINESSYAILFTIGTFEKLGYLDNNLVAIGANGCGKTALAENIKRYVKTNCVVIGAQKLLLLPKFNSVLDTESSQKQLSEQQAKDKALRQPLDYDRDENEHSIADDVADEFSAVINNLLAIHNAEIHKFANKVIEDNTTPREKTILEKVFDLWHQIMPHRCLTCPDGINIMVHTDANVEYPAYQLSDGEKVTLYLIADVMQTPANSYIVVDEPETYLHKSIVNKLWDLLENERKKDNCTFVYLTHNVDFAASRHAKKIWIKSYNPKAVLKWDICDIPDEDIPQDLLLEILGSRRPILFCEGVKDKATCSDAQIYEVLYPQFTIKPLGSCRDVINYTRAFNLIPNNVCKAYGIIDADYRSPEKIKEYLEAGIYTTNVSEIENLFLLEEFLKGMASWLHTHDSPDVCFEYIQKAVKKEFTDQIDIQVSQYVSDKIDHYFKEVHMKEAKKKEDIATHYSDFRAKIHIDEWVTEREEHLRSISDNYAEIIKTFNNKGLRNHANNAFKITNFSDRAFDYLRASENAKNVLRCILPKELSEIS